MPINMSWTACNMYVSVCQSADKSVRVPILLLSGRVCRPSRLLLSPSSPVWSRSWSRVRAKKEPESCARPASSLVDVLRRNAAARHDDDRYRTSRSGSRWSGVHQRSPHYLGSVDVRRSISDRRYTRCTRSLTERVRGT